MCKMPVWLSSNFSPTFVWPYVILVQLVCVRLRLVLARFFPTWTSISPTFVRGIYRIKINVRAYSPLPESCCSLIYFTCEFVWNSATTCHTHVSQCDTLCNIVTHCGTHGTMCHKRALRTYLLIPPSCCRYEGSLGSKRGPLIGTVCNGPSLRTSRTRYSSEK